MIYRIRVRKAVDGLDGHSALWDAFADSDFHVPRGRFSGRGRFWFTEKGWNERGRGIAAMLRRRGNDITVIRRKNPKKGDVCYCDPWQVVLLPTKRK